MPRERGKTAPKNVKWESKGPANNESEIPRKPQGGFNLRAKTVKVTKAI